MLPFGNALFGGAGSYASVIAAVSYTATSNAQSAVLSTLGAQAGDLCLVAQTANGGSPTLNGTNMTSIGFATYWRILSAADLTKQIANPNGDFLVVIYRGPASIADMGDQIASVVGTNTLAGFVKSQRHMGLVAVGTSSNTTSTILRPQTPVLWPIAINSPRVKSAFYQTISHLLPRQSPIYPDNAPIQWQATSTSPSQLITIIELRR